MVPEFQHDSLTAKSTLFELSSTSTALTTSPPPPPPHLFPPEPRGRETGVEGPGRNIGQGEEAN
mgnify:CR=1 FL=1